ncbi:phage tail protein I [Jiella endophytica]|uniref:Phage tail protein I n=1 Tax=Jiella endophytica TaxID=2558362 RepID=A0A4Y8REX3_9HYPH|nr:phage tail protein I [Jiella endophytica]TFF20822.1 phage tail protein I [Jiella endophytica]
MAELTIDALVALQKPIAAQLLPPNATPIERAVLTAELARLAKSEPEIVATVWHPQTCPAALLPWLAWALSVDTWDDRWPEAVKRDVIAASPQVHRLKGTRAAVEEALTAMRLAIKIEEWWEDTTVGRRGTFRITVYVNEHIYDDELSVLNAKVQRHAIAATRGAKPKSRVFDFRLGVKIDGGFGAATVGEAVEVQRHDATHEHQRIREAAPGALTAGAGVQVSRLPATADAERVLADAHSAAVAGAPITASRRSAETQINRIILALAGLSARGESVVAHRGNWSLR